MLERVWLLAHNNALVYTVGKAIANACVKPSGQLHQIIFNTESAEGTELWDFRRLFY